MFGLLLQYIQRQQDYFFFLPTRSLSPLPSEPSANGWSLLRSQIVRGVGVIWSVDHVPAAIADDSTGLFKSL